MSVIRSFLLLGLLGVLAACGGVETIPTPTEVEPSPTPSPSPMPAPTSTPLPEAISIESVLIASMIFPHSFSPDNNFLAYWTFSQEELETYFHPNAPPGTLHFLNVSTGEICESPSDVAYGLGQNLAWLPDGKVVLAAGGRLLVGTACSQDFDDVSHLFTGPIGIVSVNPDHSLFLLASEEGLLLYEPQSGNIRKVDESIRGGGVSWSPGFSRLGITGALPSGCEGRTCQMATRVVTVQTGAVEDIVHWTALCLEDCGGPVWMSEDRFLIPLTVDQGPLFFTVGEGVVPIVSDLFKLQPAEYCTGEECETYLQADGRAVDGTDNYHLMLFGWGSFSQYPNIRLYHSENGLIEELPFRYYSPGYFDYSPGFSSDGRLLFLSRLRGEDADTTTNQLWFRPVDPPEGASQLLLSTPLSLYWYLSPDGTMLSIGAEFPTPSFRSVGLIYLFSLPEGEQIETWSTGEDWSPLEAFWSLDGKLLAVRGSPPSWAGGSRQEEALFIIEIP